MGRGAQGRGEDGEGQLEGRIRPTSAIAGESLTTTGLDSHQRFSVSSRAEQGITTDVLSAPILPALSQV